MSGLNSAIAQSTFLASVMLGYIHAQSRMNPTNETTMTMVMNTSFIVLSELSIQISFENKSFPNWFHVISF
tara:strand:- start:2451 stop:2663 length:213 start_codon:yes stop_codon:yes gene_type:complete